MAENENERYFQYGDRELDYLRRKDKKMADVIDKVGFVQRRIHPDLFSSLLFCVVGQQISGKVQVTVWKKIEAALGEITPERVSSIEPEALRGCGVSWRKVEYMQGIARQIMNGEFNMEGIRDMDDNAVCEELCKLRGIGKWTAEMLMIFSLERSDVFSFGDFGIRRGLRMIYRHREITPELFEKYRRRFSPYCSVASLYLWAVAGGALPGMADPAANSRGSRE